jgi:hypothetical protein
MSWINQLLYLPISGFEESSPLLGTGSLALGVGSGADWGLGMSEPPETGTIARPIKSLLGMVATLLAVPPAKSIVYSVEPETAKAVFIPFVSVKMSNPPFGPKSTPRPLPIVLS